MMFKINRPSSRYDAIVMGVSAGGLDALKAVVSGLSDNFTIAAAKVDQIMSVENIGVFLAGLSRV